MSRTLFKWGGMKAKRTWIDKNGDWITGNGEEAKEIYNATHDDAQYYQWAREGLDPRTNANSKKDESCYRYSFGIIFGTAFGLYSRNYFIGENPINALLRPVRDVNE